MVGVFTRIVRGVSGDHSSQLQQALESKPVLCTVSLKDGIGSGKVDLSVVEEFAPVEPPREPQDNEKPVRCPAPEPCIVHDGRIWKERIVASAARRRAEYPIARESSLPTSYQRRQKLEHNNFLLPSFSAPEKQILKLLEDAAAISNAGMIPDPPPAQHYENGNPDLDLAADDHLPPKASAAAAASL